MKTSTAAAKVATSGTRKLRTCLRMRKRAGAGEPRYCGKEFMSNGPGDRTCPVCRKNKPDLSMRAATESGGQSSWKTSGSNLNAS